MKKLLVWVFVLMFAISAAAFAEGGDASLQAILDKGELVMGLDDSFPPMGYRDDDNNIVGYDVDLATEVCARMGITLKLQPIEWAAKELELSSGNIDCIWNGMTITEERLASMFISLPYLRNEQALVVLEGSEYQTLEDLAGKNLGLQAGSSAADALENNAEFKASLGSEFLFDDNLTAMLDLDNGGVDAVLMDSVVAGYMMSQKEGAYRLLSEALAGEEYGIGFRKQDEALGNEINRILQEMDKDGTLAAISTEWFSEDISIIKEAQ